MEIDGVHAVTTSAALQRLQDEFPAIPPARLRALLVAEWEASTGGVPLVVPSDVEDGIRERLIAGSIVDISRIARR